MKIASLKSDIARVVGHYFMTSAGYFGLLSTLVVVLNAEGWHAEQIALVVTIFTFVNKVAKIPLAPWLDHFTPAKSVLLGCGMAAAGLFCMHLAHSIVLTTAALMLTSIGISINALACKQLAAGISDNAANRAKMFSVINIAVNIASAIAAPLALMLVERKLYWCVTWGVAAVYLAAGCATSLSFAQKRDDHRATTAKPSLRTYLRIARLPGILEFLLINFFGWFLYGQLFNVFALHVSQTLNLSARLGWLYTLNALLVVCLQMGVTSHSERLHDGRPLRAVQISFLIYMLAFAAAWLLPGYSGVIVMVVFFTLAEMIFMPQVDVLLLGLIGKENRAVSYSVLSVSTALGESAGAGSGLMGYRWMMAHDHVAEFWLLAACIALLFALMTNRVVGASHALRSQAFGV